jgi:hypothetical protein
MDSEIISLMQEIKTINKVEPVDLRYFAGKWSVRIEYGNAMMVVPGSVKQTALAALRHARDLMSKFEWVNKGESKNE